MRTEWISFAKLPSGSRFEARGKVWVKAAETVVIEGVRLNAYEYTALQQAQSDEAIPCDMFNDEVLVRFDPEEELHSWSLV